MSLCKLCQKPKPLIKRSHIIPDFLYKNAGVYDKNHKFRSFTIGDLLNGKKPKIMQSGIHEGNILCSDCDNDKLGVNLEQYASSALYGLNTMKGGFPQVTQHIGKDGEKISVVSNINYAKFKLFLLSILWRASISSKPFFRDISLGRHEDTLREMIDNNDPKKFNDYPCMVISTLLDKSFPEDAILQPWQFIASDGMTGCCFIMGGFMYSFKIGTVSKNLKAIEHSTINESNELIILHTKPGATMPMVRSLLNI